jgi:hypothetical protein
MLYLTTAPTEAPTIIEPTAKPTDEPTSEPTTEPTTEAVVVPTASSPTAEAVAVPTTATEQTYEGGGVSITTSNSVTINVGTAAKTANCERRQLRGQTADSDEAQAL